MIRNSLSSRFREHNYLGLPVRRSELMAEARLTQSLRPSDSNSVGSSRGKEVVRAQISSAKAYLECVSTKLLVLRTLRGLRRTTTAELLEFSNVNVERQG
jgi:hypothetical protein